MQLRAWQLQLAEHWRIITVKLGSHGNKKKQEKEAAEETI